MTRAARLINEQRQVIRHKNAEIHELHGILMSTNALTLGILVALQATDDEDLREAIDAMERTQRDHLAQLEEHVV